MKLIDFIKSGYFIDLLNKMNAPLIDNWEASKDWKDLTDKELEIMSIEGIDVPVDDENLKLSEEGHFLYKGKKVVVYIRDQRFYPKFGEPEYKFHITNCKTLMEMKQKNRFNSRYVVSNRKDGKFIVNLKNMSAGVINKGLENELKVCKYCLRSLSYKGYPGNLNVYNEFNLNEFFKVNFTTVDKLPHNSAESAPLSVYPENWEQLSRGIKEEMGWICEKCGINLKDNPKYLHTHHIDGNPSNNNFSNLKVLCIKCHSEEFIHSHLKFSPGFKKFMRL